MLNSTAQNEEPRRSRIMSVPFSLCFYFFFFGFCRLLYRNETKRQLVRSGAHRGFVLVEVAERVLRAVVVRIVVPEWPAIARKVGPKNRLNRATFTHSIPRCKSLESSGFGICNAPNGLISSSCERFTILPIRVALIQERKGQDASMACVSNRAIVSNYGTAISANRFDDPSLFILDRSHARSNLQETSVKPRKREQSKCN